MSLRRCALVAALFVATVAAVGVRSVGSSAKSAVRSDCHTGVPPVLHDGFPEPPTRYSHHGVLDTTLRASVSRVLINHRRVLAMDYDGSFPGPTLVICAGDRGMSGWTVAL